MVVGIALMGRPAEVDAQPDPTEVRYVDADVEASGDGTTWETAYKTLQEALTVASDPANEVDEIRVADGVYLPTLASDPQDERSKSFGLIAGVRILGGFAGREDPAAAREPGRYLTILSGDLDGNDDQVCESDADCAEEPPTTLCIDGRCIGENAYHVVEAINVLAEPEQSPAVLDGVTVAGGVANGAFKDPYGGGVLVWVGNPTFSNCTLEGNYALHGGGAAVRDSRSLPSFEDCTFVNNVAVEQSGEGGEGGSVFVLSCLDRPDCLDTSTVCDYFECDNYECVPEGNNYGDVVQDGVVSVFDILCIMEWIQEDGSEACSFQDADIHPCEPNGTLSVQDALAVVGTFSGIDPCCSQGACCLPDDSCLIVQRGLDCLDLDGEFAGKGTTCEGVTCPLSPAPNPPEGAAMAASAGPTPSGGTVDISLSVSPASGPAGTRFQVDVFASDFSGLRGYEVALRVTGGSTGSLKPVAIEIDQRRRDYAFAQLKPLIARDLSTPRVVGVLPWGSVESATPVYVATFVYQASSDARGTFTVTVVPGDGTRGTMIGASNSRLMQPVLDAGVTVTVTAPAP